MNRRIPRTEAYDPSASTLDLNLLYKAVQRYLHQVNYNHSPSARGLTWTPGGFENRTS